MKTDDDNVNKFGQIVFDLQNARSLINYKQEMSSRCLCCVELPSEDPIVKTGGLCPLYHDCLALTAPCGGQGRSAAACRHPAGFSGSCTSRPPPPTPGSA